MTDDYLSIKSARESAKEWVWCKGWSPHEGAFARPMPQLGYSSSGDLEYDLAGACSEELRHPNSGCQNVSTEPLRASTIEEVAHQIQAARIAAHEADRPHREKWAAANAFLGRVNMGMVEIGDDLAHVRRSSDGAIAVIELVDGQWRARKPREDEAIYI